MAVPGAGSLDVERGLGRRVRPLGEEANANAAVGGQLRTFKSETCTCFVIDPSRSRPVRPVRVVSARAPCPAFKLMGLCQPWASSECEGCHVLNARWGWGPYFEREEWTDGWSD